MEVLENKYHKMWMEDNILRCIYKSKEITLKIAQKGVEDRLLFCKGKTYPLLGDLINLKNVTSDARKFLASGKSLDALTAGAFIVKSPISKYVVNFWMKINRPALPSKFFTNEEEAIAWLQKYKSEQV